MPQRIRRSAGFAADVRGAVSVIFSLSLLPTLLLIGSAIDYTTAARDKGNVKSAADMAVLVAARSFAQSYSSGAHTGDEARELANEQGRNFFLMNVQPAARGATIRIDTGVSDGVVTATGAFSGSTSLSFGKLLGVHTIPFSGVVKASLAMTNAIYRNIHVVVDISQSMGIGASETDMAALKARTGCIFGCHASTNIRNPTTNLQVARANNIPLRIDVVRNATRDMVARASSGDTDRTLKFALYTMQNRDYRVLKELSQDYDALSQAATQIDLGPSFPSGPGDSEMATALSALSILVPQSGDGSSSSRAKTYLFIMTDGVRDYPGRCPYGHCVSAFDPQWCEAFKSKGVIVGVIYTTYIPFVDWSYRDLVAPIIDRVAPNLQSCASPGYYFEAADGPAIQEKVAELFGKAINHLPRLTQ